MLTTINLQQNFSITGGAGLHPKIVDFPSGCEPHVKIDHLLGLGVFLENVLITCRLSSMDELMRLFLLTDALRRVGTKHLQVFIPYLPFARQDRVMVKGEPLSLKVLADLINTQKYEKVTIYDPHSDVSAALIDNCEVIKNHKFIAHVVDLIHGQTDLSETFPEDYYLISPDAGAYKKIFEVAQHIKFKGEIVMCNKVRDVSNGVIRSLTVSHHDLEQKPCYIIDDICDGGGTFNMLATELKKRNAGPIYLMVSHGIFSKGISAISPEISRIFTTDSFTDWDRTVNFDGPDRMRLTQIKLQHILC